MIGLVACSRTPHKTSPEIILLHRDSSSRLGGLMAEQLSRGTVLLLHDQPSPQTVSSWVKGLESGLGTGFRVLPVSFQDLSPAARSDRFGFAPVLEALSKVTEPVAVVTALQIEPEAFPAAPIGTPPLFALQWCCLPDTLPLFRNRILSAGVFRLPLPPETDETDPVLAGALVGDGEFLLVTPGNARVLAAQGWPVQTDE